jgi:hypothetical protein
MRSIILGAAGILAAVARPAVANETAAQKPSSTTNLTLSSGIDYSSGKYSARQTTDILVALTDITLQRDDLRFSVSLPYLDIKGPTSVIAGLNGVPVAIRRSLVSATAANRAGWGDLNLGVAWSVPSEDLDDFQVDLIGRTKIARVRQPRDILHLDGEPALHDWFRNRVLGDLPLGNADGPESEKRNNGELRSCKHEPPCCFQ